MRRPPRVPRLVLSVLVVPAVVAGVLASPVAGSGAPRPHPVAPTLHLLALPAAVPGLHTLSNGRQVQLAPRATQPFSALGVTWLGSADLEVAVRTRSAVDHRWSDWRDLYGNSDDVPDNGTADVQPGARSGTVPSYVGPSDGVQVRADINGAEAPRDLRVDLIDPGTSDADRAAHLPRDSAQAAQPQPQVVTRAQWGADESMRRCGPNYTGTPRVAFVHHTDSTNDYTPDQAPAAVRSFYAYHVQSRGWCDIAYNFLVDKYGTIYEGRYGGMDRAVLGAHTLGFNSNSFGTAMIGNFATVAPSAALQSSLATILAWKLGLSYADPNGTARLTASGSGTYWPSGTTVTFNVISGHRDAVSTSCPGDVGYTILGPLRRAVTDRMGAVLYNPAVSRTTVPAGDTTPISVTARSSQPLAWHLDVVQISSGAVVRTITGQSPTDIATSWNLLDSTGTRVPPGAYTLSLAGADGTGDQVVPWTTTVTLQGAPPSPTPVAGSPSDSPTASSASPSSTASAGPVSPSPSASSRQPSTLPVAQATPSRTAQAPSPSPTVRGVVGAAYVPVTPSRVLDTRTGLGAPRAKLVAGAPLTLQLTGVAGVPAEATAVALNLTATHPSAGTHLTVYPAGTAKPETSVLNLRPGLTAASLVVAGLSPAGAAEIANLAGDVDVIADVVGYWTRAGGARYHPLSPARLLDTRTVDGGGRFADQQVRRVQVRGQGGVPTAASAVVLNVTAVGPTANGFLTVTPSGARTDTSSVNFVTGQTVPNRVISGLSPDGAVDVLAAGGATHVLVDVVGWYAPSSTAGGAGFVPVQPARLLDSRDGTGTARGAWSPDSSRTVQATGRLGVPAGASAVVLTLTATSPTAPTHVSAYAAGTARPGTSDLNLVPGETRPNLAVVPLSAAGAFTLYNAAGSVDLLADVLGYYLP